MRFWEYFEELNEYVYVADMDTHELIYMNKKLKRLCGVPLQECLNGKKCHEVIRHCAMPCSVCNNKELKPGLFKEWWYYDPVYEKNLSVKDTMIEEDGRRYHVEIAIDVSPQEWKANVVSSHENLDAVANETLRVALQKDTPDESIAVILECLGKMLNGERAYIFEQNEKGNDDNTYEWVAAGVAPMKDTLQDLPREVCANWYRKFSKDKPIVIRDLKDIRESDPLQYDNLKRQNIHSLFTVPLYKGRTPIGFFGVANPSGKYLGQAPDILQMMTHFIVASINQRDLIMRLKQEEASRTAAAFQEEMTEALVERTQENLDMVNDIIGSGLWYMDFDEKGQMTRVFWSPKFRQMLGFTDTEDFPDVLESWSDRLHPDDKEMVLAAFWDCVAGKSEYDVKYRIMKKNGEYDWFHAHGRTAVCADGTPRLFLGTFINITKDLRAQQALEEAYHAANRANAAKTEFLSSMSHDIRTPLNAIVGMTVIAATNLADTEKVRHCLSEITVSSKHLLGLVNEVLDMNKIESGKVDLNIGLFNLADMVDNFVSISKPLVAAKRHTFTMNVHDIKHENVFGDKERLEQCLMNFMSNAVKYTPEGGKLSLSITEKATNRPKISCYEFIFEDNGIGMEEEFIPMIFEPFSRSSDERAARQQGTGLGMSIARNIIQMMNGNIQVESRLDGGSKFTATIFLENQDVDDGLLDEELMDLPILVADDDQVSCENTCIILSQLGMKGDWVLTGREAIEKVMERHRENEDYFALILDWKMPDMDGVATARAIRAAVGDDIPIIIISAYDWSDIEAEARAAGVDGFISKPIFKSRVAYVFRELTGRGATESPKNLLSGYIEKISKKEEFSGKKALLVEDNELNAEIAIEILKMTGLAIDHVWNGKEAVDTLASSADGYYDLVLMDIQMPVMNGYEATRAIRGLERDYLKRIPIIAMSANAFAEDVQMAKAAGMDEHISKPLDLERLTGVLSRYCH